MNDELEYRFEPFVEEFIQKRIEQLVVEAEKLPAYIASRKGIQDVIEKASVVMDAEDLEALISAVRGTDIAIHEHIYYVGLKDGIWISNQIDTLKKH